MIEYLLEQGVSLFRIVLEYIEFLIVFSSVLFLYKIGRVGLSLGIFSVVYLMRLFFDHLWLFLIIGTEYKVGVHYWYTGFALSNFFLIATVYAAHLKLKIEFSMFSILGAVFCFFSMISQTVRYVDLLFFDNSFASLYYRASIPAFNLGLLCTLLAGVIVCLRRSNAFPERIPWRLSS